MEAMARRKSDQGFSFCGLDETRFVLLGWVSFPIRCSRWASQFLFPSEKASIWSLLCASSVFISAAKGLLMLAGVNDHMAKAPAFSAAYSSFWAAAENLSSVEADQMDCLHLGVLVRWLLDFKLNSRRSSSEGSLAEGTEVYQIIQVYRLCLFPCL